MDSTHRLSHPCPHSILVILIGYTTAVVKHGCKFSKKVAAPLLMASNPVELKSPVPEIGQAFL